MCIRDSDPLRTVDWNGQKRPQIVAQRLLLGDQRAKVHHGNLVLESSASVLGAHIYIASGAGHLYGLRRSDLAVEWDYFIGSDLDGTAVPTRRGKLLVPVEKQYIKGHGGVLCLDPSRPPEKAVDWFFPTGDRKVGEWKGGLIGSCAVNDEYNRDGRLPALAAFNAIDGYLHVVSQDTMSGRLVKGPNLEPDLQTPVEIARLWNGGAISTPLLFGETLIAASYDQRVHLYRITCTPSAKGVSGALGSAPETPSSEGLQVIRYRCTRWSYEAAISVSPKSRGVEIAPPFHSRAISTGVCRSGSRLGPLTSRPLMVSCETTCR